MSTMFEKDTTLKVAHVVMPDSAETSEGAMKTISKIITGSIVALALASTIAATPAAAAGYLLPSELSASHGNNDHLASMGSCSYFLGCADSLKLVAHAPVVPPGPMKKR